MSFEDQYLDVLHNIESTIVMYYKEHPDFIDAETEAALEWLIKYYNASSQGFTSSSRQLKGNSAELVEALKVVCDWRLGREQLPSRDEKGNPAPVNLDMENKTPSEIVACLKRIKSSVKLWTKKGGRQGYLNFIQQHIPQETTSSQKDHNNPLKVLLGLFKKQ